MTFNTSIVSGMIVFGLWVHEVRYWYWRWGRASTPTEMLSLKQENDKSILG